jgi:hypothetical protein
MQKFVLVVNGRKVTSGSINLVRTKAIEFLEKEVCKQANLRFSNKGDMKEFYYKDYLNNDNNDVEPCFRPDLFKWNSRKQSFESSVSFYVNHTDREQIRLFYDNILKCFGCKLKIVKKH